jgi:nucleotide-binding universal stress UspA family protein
VYEHVLLPLGRDPDRTATAEHAFALAAAFDARLHVLHVVDLAEKGRSADGRTSGEGRTLEQVVTAAEAEDLATAENVREGTPHDEILAYVDEADIDLVVMGTHGKSGLARVLLGSTAEEVVRQSPVPVLTVKG